MKKVLMKSDKTLENINRLKSIITSLNEQISSLTNSDEINKTMERLNFMEKMLIDQTEVYEKQKNNDSPYYEDGSIQYYTEKFKNLSNSDLNSTFAREVVHCIESERMKNKLNSIKNIVKAYNTREQQIFDRYINKS